MGLDEASAGTCWGRPDEMKENQGKSKDDVDTAHQHGETRSKKGRAGRRNTNLFFSVL